MGETVQFAAEGLAIEGDYTTLCLTPETYFFERLLFTVVADGQGCELTYAEMGLPEPATTGDNDDDDADGRWKALTELAADLYYGTGLTPGPTTVVALYGLLS